MRRSLIAGVVLSVLSGSVLAEEWPKWRGPKGDGISREENLLEQWPAGGPKEVWKADVGLGHSSPIGVDGKVYTFTLDERTTEALRCLDAETGKEIWKQTHSGGWTGGMWPGTRATPVIEGDRIYTYGGNGDLHCRQLVDGKAIWHLNVLSETSSQKRKDDWGEASSPLIDGDRIIVQGRVGPVAVAVDKNTGKMVWQGPRGQGGYAHPIIVDVQGTKQLIVFAGSGVYALKPESGEQIWQVPWETMYDVNATTPIYRDGHLFITSGYENGGSMMLKLNATGAPSELWRHKAGAAANNHIKGKFPGVILEGNVLYANSEGKFKAMSWPDGKILWTAGNINFDPGTSILRFGKDKMVAFTERGTLYLLNVTPQGAKIISQIKPGTGNQNWSTPLIYRGKLYVQTMKNGLFCYDIAAK